MVTAVRSTPPRTPPRLRSAARASTSAASRRSAPATARGTPRPAPVPRHPDRRSSPHASLPVLRHLRPPGPPDQDGRRRQQHRQRQHRRLQEQHRPSSRTRCPRCCATARPPPPPPRGTNPAQVGLGVKVAEITTNFSQGSTQSTGRASDFMISGDGFFVTSRGQPAALHPRGVLRLRRRRAAGHPRRRDPAGLDGRPTTGVVNTNGPLETCPSPSARPCHRWPRRTARPSGNLSADAVDDEHRGADPGDDVRPAGQGPPDQLRLHRPQRPGSDPDAHTTPGRCR